MSIINGIVSFVDNVNNKLSFEITNDFASQQEEEVQRWQTMETAAKEARNAAESARDEARSAHRDELDTSITYWFGSSFISSLSAKISSPA